MNISTNSKVETQPLPELKRHAQEEGKTAKVAKIGVNLTANERLLKQSIKDNFPKYKQIYWYKLCQKQIIRGADEESYEKIYNDILNKDPKFKEEEELRKPIEWSEEELELAVTIEPEARDGNPQCRFSYKKCAEIVNRYEIFKGRTPSALQHLLRNQNDRFIEIKRKRAQAQNLNLYPELILIGAIKQAPPQNQFPAPSSIEGLSVPQTALISSGEDQNQHPFLPLNGALSEPPPFHQANPPQPIPNSSEKDLNDFAMQFINSN